MPTLLNEPLARHGWWRVGGPMDRFVIADTLDELVQARAAAAGGPLLLLGNGSNLLAPDDGVRGTVVRLGAAFRSTDVVADDGDAVRLRVGAGLPNAVLLARLAKLGLGGAGSLAGVPGTVGGAVAMNAGTVLGEIADALDAVEGLDATGGTRAIARAALPMAYREGGLPEGFIVTAATLRLSRGAFAEEQAHIAHHLARRKATQPLDLPSCGSTFRNPPGDAAGRLIEAAGLKGHTVGAAQISPKHANFIVNLGGARASDVMACIRAAWSGVRERCGVTLVPEVHVVGEWPADVWPLPG
jgi:UDP-N-acetylmuramate dehydrogenase